MARLKNRHLYLGGLGVFFRIEDDSHCTVSHVMQLSREKTQFFQIIFDIFVTLTAK